MSEDIHQDRVGLMAIFRSAHAKRPDEYPDFELLNAMSDSGLIGYARGLLYSLEQSPPKDEVAQEVRGELRAVIKSEELS